MSHASQRSQAASVQQMVDVIYQNGSVRVGELLGKQALVGVYLTSIYQEPLTRWAKQATPLSPAARCTRFILTWQVTGQCRCVYKGLPATFIYKGTN